MIWHCADFDFDTRMPIVMGILNVTPDSFSDGGRFSTVEEAVACGQEMADQGALIIDVGGESTRPGAAEVPVGEELSRVVEVVRQLAGRGICVSIDTRHAEVARACLEAGAAIINDVSGFGGQAMVDLARDSECGLVVTHGFAEHQSNPDGPNAEGGAWRDIVAITAGFLAQRCAQLEAAGIARSRICVDPGPGFGKTDRETVELVRNFHEIRHVGYPVMAALSRKRYIGYAYGIPEPSARDEASAQEACMACELGASIVRTHNVPATLEALKALRPYALVAMGCNVALVADEGEEREGKIAQMNMAVGDMCLLPDTQLIDVSSYYESEPAYYEDQEPFVNAVALLRTGVAPHELLGYLHSIENKYGRVRTIENGPRTCDLDILDYQLYVCDDEELVLPHPRVCERDFVVKPLLEILPGHVLSDGTPVESVVESARVGHAVRVARS